MKPLAFDLYCGLGGWAEGFLSEGYRVVGFDIEKHDYGTGGYPGELVLRDVRSICGAELIAEYGIPAVIVGSSPCQEFSYRAMPWKRAKALPPPYLGMELFQAQFRIQREMSEAAGRYIPMIVENVRGAQKWVGRASANYGSYYLWGDVGMVGRRVVAGDLQFGVSVAPVKATKVPGFRFDGSGGSFQTASVEAQKHNPDGTAHGSGSWFKISDSNKRGAREGVKIASQGLPLRHPKSISPEWRAKSYTQELSEVKGFTPNGEPLGKNTLGRKYGSKPAKRKAASAMIAKIPFPLACHIAKCFKPETLTSKSESATSSQVSGCS